MIACPEAAPAQSRSVSLRVTPLPPQVAALTLGTFGFAAEG